MNATKSRARILDGIRVMDFTDALAGPVCTRYLADCGCEVINVERPRGKVVRSLAYVKDGYSAEYLQYHCGKKSVAIDLKAKGARELILHLTKVSDVVVENFRPGVMEKLGLDYGALKKANPSIIMCSISGWGQTGPHAGLMGVDLLIQSARGLAHMSSRPGERPSFAGFAVSDILAGVNAFAAICAALYRREKTGEGECIDVGLSDCLLAALGNAVGTHILSRGQDETRYMVGSFSPDVSPCGAFRGRDGYLTIFIRTDEGWERFAEAAGKPELATDPRLATREARLKNHEYVTEVVENWLLEYESVNDAAILLQSYRILASPVASLASVIDEDPQTRAREMIVEMDHPSLGPFKFVNTPLRFCHSRAYVNEPPPVEVGQDTDAVLREALGLGEEEIKKYRRDGIVF